MRYGSGEERPEDKAPIAACVVSHPDAFAGPGPCHHEAIGEVWSLPFCELHGREAELAAREEMASSLEGIFTGLQAVEQERHDRNETAVKIIEEAMAQASRPKSWRPTPTPTPSATISYDYEDTGMDNPHDWWCEAQIMTCRFMRQAHDHGLSGLLKELEHARERATVQRLLVYRTMDLQCEAVADV